MSNKNKDLSIECPEIKDLDFTFPEVDQMEGIPWYQTSKEWKLKKEAENQKK